MVHDDPNIGQVCPHLDRTSLHPGCTSLTAQLHSEEVEVWPGALVDCSDRQGTEGIGSADFETGWDLEAVVGAGTLGGVPRQSLPTYSWNCS